jgi:hypothetical protein
MPEHAAHAARWADAMLLFERVHDHDLHLQPDHSQMPMPMHHQLGRVTPYVGSPPPQHQQQLLYVRRLWSRAGLLKRLEEARRMVMVRVGSPWASGGFYGAVGNGYPGAGVAGMNAVVNGSAGYGMVNGVNGRMPVAMAVPGRRGGDIWW